MANAMDGKQYLLHHILDPVWRPVLPCSQRTDEGQNLAEQPLNTELPSQTVVILPALPRMSAI